MEYNVSTSSSTCGRPRLLFYCGSFNFGFSFGVSIVGRFGVGFLSTKFELRRLVTVCFTMIVIALIVLINAKTLPLLCLYAVLFGIAWGGIIISVYTMVGAYFGRTNYSQLLGWVMPISAVFSASAPLIAGHIRDVTGSYTPAFTIPIFLTVAGLVCTFFARPPKLPPSMSAL